ncbi:hypothetical protein C8J56DRAFT_899220 [Mycena floridula]|nr:hypothetical protein C8J56DRAFT_899220 [Mycena floridula]
MRLPTLSTSNKKKSPKEMPQILVEEGKVVQRDMEEELNVDFGLRRVLASGCHISRPPPGSRPFTHYSMATGLVVELGVGIHSRQSDWKLAFNNPWSPVLSHRILMSRCPALWLGLSSWMLLHFPSQVLFKQAEQTGSLNASAATLSMKTGYDYVSCILTFQGLYLV